MAVNEISRDLEEMGILVHPQTMQDKMVANDPNYATKELRGYSFKVVDFRYNNSDIAQMICYVINRDPYKATQATDEIQDYIEAEHDDRTAGVPMNPGHSWLKRQSVWNEFIHDGRFAYTYSERIAPQLASIVEELRLRPETRQAIINIHSNICAVPSYARKRRTVTDSNMIGVNEVWGSADLENKGGNGRIPCSMYYQFMVREGKLDMIYTMRSCDFLTHFPVDFALALKMQTNIADHLGYQVGTFTYFAGSFHAYAKDLAVRGIF